MLTNMILMKAFLEILKFQIDSGACDEGEDRMPKDNKLFLFAGILEDEFDYTHRLARLNTRDAMSAILHGTESHGLGGG